MYCQQNFTRRKHFTSHTASPHLAKPDQALPNILDVALTGAFSHAHAPQYVPAINLPTGRAKLDGPKGPRVDRLETTLNTETAQPGQSTQARADTLF